MLASGGVCETVAVASWAAAVVKSICGSAAMAFGLSIPIWLSSAARWVRGLGTAWQLRPRVWPVCLLINDACSMETSSALVGALAEDRAPSPQVS